MDSCSRVTERVVLKSVRSVFSETLLMRTEVKHLCPLYTVHFTFQTKSRQTQRTLHKLTARGNLFQTKEYLDKLYKFV